MLRKQAIFPGIILIGIGMYFSLEQFQISTFHLFYSWPTLLIIIGVAFLAQAYATHDFQKIIPGFILLGIGLHFHLLKLVGFWPDHWAIFTFIIGAAFLLRYQKTKNGFTTGVLLLVLSILALFYQEVISWIGWVGSINQIVRQYWPLILIFAGVYILFFKKK